MNKMRETKPAAKSTKFEYCCLALICSAYVMIPLMALLPNGYGILLGMTLGLFWGVAFIGAVLATLGNIAYCWITAQRPSIACRFAFWIFLSQVTVVLVSELWSAGSQWYDRTFGPPFKLRN